MQSKVYILYTGGTFGMKHNADGSLEPSNWSTILEFLPAINNRSYFRLFSEIDYTFDHLDTVVDSSDITPEHWQTIADKIYANYESHDGFIVIHGTDTMAYTASALSFVFDKLNKPVILTGSQLPIFNPRTDGISNLSNAIYIAAYKTFGVKKIPEVCICFNDDLLRGNRSTKSSTNDFEGFSSPNFENLASLEQNITVGDAIRPTEDGEFAVKSAFSDTVVNVTVFPGYNPSVLKELVKAHQIEGIVLRTFGAGNVPKNSAWQELIDLCLENKIIILATTQCPNGQIEIGQYKSGKVLDSAIVIDGKDITPEAALTKLMWAIGNYPFEERIDILNKNLRGEISVYN